MKLTDEAKIDFLEYYWSKYIGKSRFYNQKEETEDFFNYLYPIFQNALIIEWFDSIGIYITIKNKFGQNKQARIFWYSLNKGEKNNDVYLSRSEATNKAIEKANQIYNQEKHGKI